MMNRDNLIRAIIGAVMVLLGILIIFVKSFTLNFWLLFIWIPAVFMEYRAFTGRDKNLFVPGGILLTVAMILTLNVIFSGFITGGGWALFIAAPAVGLFQSYFGETEKDRGALISASVLSVISLLFLFILLAPTVLGVFIGILLLAAGGLVVYKSLRTTRR
ncbi:hypothetical protein [Mesotoga sp.]|jgi:hypothetical protein|uniref:hypothetical protein n=1 Tax=Mesotoga sp. TaxID=2053577 RepID=UPI00345ED8DA